MTTSNSKQMWLAALCTGAVLALTACPPPLTPDPLEPMPQILAFTGSAAEVPSGSTLTLSWRVEHATEVSIEELTLGALSGVSGLEGTVEVAVSTQSLFVLTARNARGATDSAVVGVRVQGEPSGLLFIGSKSTVEAGQPVTLAWSAPGANSVTVTAAPGGPLELGGQTESGAVVVRPVSSTTYTITAGGRTASVEVRVTASITSFTATPTVAAASEQVTLAWVTSNADRVQLLAPGRPALLDTSDPAQVAAGTFSETLPAVIDPGQLFTYELKVTSGAVTLSRTVMVTVEGTPAISSFNAPAVARRGAGQSISLDWTTVETDEVSIAANGVEIYRSPSRAIALAGALTLPSPEIDTIYQLTASSSRGGAVTASRGVDSLGVPSVALTASPQAATGGEVVTLSWTGSEIRSLTITSSTSGLVVVRQGMLDSGTARVRVNGDCVFTIVADNSLGDTASATAAVTVTSPVTLSMAEAGALRFGQLVFVTASIPGELTGLPHENVVVRSGSTGFLDIALSGTKLVFPTTGNIVASIDSPFRTVLFGRTVGQHIRVSRYGYLVFGEHLNGANSVDVALPSTKLEPMAIAPYWESLTSSGVYWEVRTAGGATTLIVQWDTSSSSVQAKISSTGQIDFEYSNLPTAVGGKAGVTGPVSARTLVPPTPSEGTGFTFFGPLSQPALVPVYEAGRLTGTLENAAGQSVRAELSLADVVSPDELVLTEVLPRSTVGQSGQWVELTNWRQSPIDLTGWALTFADGGSAPLTATIPARGTLVIGASLDPSLNDDAGVQVAVPGFELSGDRTLALTRSGTHQTLDWTSADGGTADAGRSTTFDPGPFRYSDAGATFTPTVSCNTTLEFGWQVPPQRGTPGADVGCGFPYARSTIPVGYFDIAAAAYALSFVEEDDAVSSISLGLAPVPFFGVLETALNVSTNGFVSFEPALSTHQFTSLVVPSTTDVNSVLAIFGDDVQGNRATYPDSNVYARRLGQGEDPFAAAPHWIIQWHHFSHFTNTVASRDDLNFQIKLFDDGVIEYHFAEMRGGPVSSQYASGGDAVTWLEGPGGAQALVINAQSTSPGISPHTAFRFTPRGSP